MSEFIDVEWFDIGSTGMPNQTVGVVLMYNEIDGFKCYIGIGNGVSQEDDMEYIAKRGQKMSFMHAYGIWGSRMRAEWISRNLSADDLSFFKYDGHEYKNKGY